MKEKTQKRIALLLTWTLAVTAVLSGCSQPDEGTPSASLTNTPPEPAGQEAPLEPAEPEEEPESPSPAQEDTEETDTPQADTEENTAEEQEETSGTAEEEPSEPVSAPEPQPTGSESSQGAPSENSIAEEQLYVSFGDDGSPFVMHLYENETAAAIARHVGTADWRLPIYHYDDYDNWEVMQYYDIPSRYEIPSNPEAITQEQAGAVYYSEPNRIVLFYGDGEVSGEYTPVGYFDVTQEFVSAVTNNPVLEGWGNKIVLISAQG